MNKIRLLRVKKIKFFNKSETEGLSSRGVKGASCLSKLEKIPEQIFFDKMHSTARGAMEMADLWLNPNYSHKPWYIGSPRSRA